jgi:hypothetical protein
MNKRLLTTIATHQFGGALFIVLFFVAINLISIAQGQPAASNKSLTNSETSSNRLRSVNGAKTVVRVHDTAERQQIALFHSYADCKPDAKINTDAKGEANARAPSYLARLKAGYSYFGTTI